MLFRKIIYVLPGSIAMEEVRIMMAMYQKETNLNQRELKDVLTTLSLPLWWSRG